MNGHMIVMAGFDPGAHAAPFRIGSEALRLRHRVGGRIKSGHDGMLEGGA
jgi:hypothetical protein